MPYFSLHVSSLRMLVLVALDLFLARAGQLEGANSVMMTSNDDDVNFHHRNTLFLFAFPIFHLFLSQHQIERVILTSATIMAKGSSSPFAAALLLVAVHASHGSAFQIPLSSDSLSAFAHKASSELISFTPPITLPSSPDPEVEAEVFSNLSHAFGEILPLMGGPTLIFRLSILFGRTFQLAADYISDKSVLSKELPFELPLLGISLVLVWRSLAPILKAVFTTPSELDQIVFEQLFEPVGVNWLQFRSLLATACIDWVEKDPGHVLESETESAVLDDTVYLYWLYEGEVSAHYQGDLMWEVERHDGKSIDDPTAVGLFADMKFLYSLDLKEKHDQSKEEVKIVRYPLATLKVGSKGASLMRISSSRLFDLMEHDEQLEASIRKLLLKSLQRKVGLLLRSKSEGQLASSQQMLEQLPNELSL